MKIQLDFNARITIAFIAAIVGLGWQGALVTLGYPANEALITAFSTILLATIGIGIKTDGNNGSSGAKKDDSKS
jgi:hypothetical protein